MPIREPITAPTEKPVRQFGVDLMVDERQAMVDGSAIAAKAIICTQRGFNLIVLCSEMDGEVIDKLVKLKRERQQVWNRFSPCSCYLCDSPHL
jgi:hypothetical protein